MKISWNWLKRHVDIDGIDPFRIAENFTMSVAELEKVYEIGKDIDDVLVGKITELKSHPDSDKLLVAVCDIGGKSITMVSGAPNLREGSVIPVAIAGAKLPGGIKVNAIPLKGVMSEGTPLSERDLGISDDHSGVLILPDDARAGEKLVSAFPIKDVIFEIDNKSMTHRPDLFCHRGIAREIAALTERKLKPFDISFTAGTENLINVRVDDIIRCPRYMAVVYDNVHVSESPFWLKQFLVSIGIRSINNVVDITNFVMMDVGNPVHAFDINYIEGREIIIRCAKEGEIIGTLDGFERNLTTEDLIIADKYKPIAIAGVIGGENSEIKPYTTTVVLESANFNAGSVRRTALRHGLRTEASARFEKSLDPDFARMALNLFSKMLIEIVPSTKIISPVYDISNFSNKPVIISLNPFFVDKKLGIKIPKEIMKKHLTSLNFDIAEKPDGQFEVTLPSFRATKDISIPEDLIEEIGRIHGYEKIQPQAPLMEVKWIEPLKIKKLERTIKNILSYEFSFSEVLSYSFDSESFLQHAGIILEKRIALKNPISQDMKYLRTSLIPNLILAGERNIVHYENFKIYEIGRIFHTEHDRDGIPLQEKFLSGLIYKLKDVKTEESFYFTKGYVQILLSKLGFRRADINKPFISNLSWIHPSKNISIIIDSIHTGYISQIHPQIMRNLKIDGTMCVFEVHLSKLTSLSQEEVLYNKIPRLPGVPFDLSIIVPENVRVATIENIIKEQSGNLLKKAKIFAIFRGEPIPQNQKSVSFNLYFQTDERTLQIKEVQEIVDKILDNLKSLGGYLRK